MATGGFADPNSIMCYQLPGAIIKDRQTGARPLDIDPQDFEFMGKIYPNKRFPAVWPLTTPHHRRQRRLLALFHHSRPDEKPYPERDLPARSSPPGLASHPP